METQQNESYNGWGNYQTWKVALNIDNDENLYNESREEIRRFRIRNGNDLKAWFCEIAQIILLSEIEKFKGYGYLTEQDEEEVSRLKTLSYKVFDEWTESELNEVDFDEIFTAFNSEVENDE